MRSERSPLWLTIWTTAIAIVTLLGLVVGLPDPELPPTFTEAQQIVGEEVETRTLPARLFATANNSSSVFRFNWNAAKHDIVEPVFYASSVLHIHHVRINGVEHDDRIKYSRLLSDTSRPLLIPLPTTAATHTIDIELAGSAVMGGYVSRVWVGERSEIQPLYAKRQMATVGFRKFLSYWLLLLSLTGALLWLLRKQEQSLGLFAIIMSCQVLDNLPVLVDNSYLLTEWFRVSYLTDFWKSVILVPFTYFFTHTQSPVKLKWFLALCGVASLLSATVPSEHFLSMEQYLLIPVSCVHLVWGITIMSRAAWRGQREPTLVLTTLLMATVFALHDIGIIMGLITQRSNFLLVYAFLPVLTTIGLILIVRFVQIQSQLDNMLITLKSQLEQRESQLRKAFQREQKIQNQRTVTDERQRILSDMHDGLGGQLMSIIASASSNKPDNDVISLHARQALTDLRLMILSLDTAHQDLIGLLAAFRERAESQCDSFGIGFQWQASELPNVQALSPATAANLLRITQEALQNALRHSGASQITLTATGDGSGGLALQVMDNGTGRAEAGNGHGIHNMRRRALAINALLVVDSNPSGTTVSLSVPQSSLSGPSDD